MFDPTNPRFLTQNQRAEFDQVTTATVLMRLLQEGAPAAQWLLSARGTRLDGQLMMHTSTDTERRRALSEWQRILGAGRVRRLTRRVREISEDRAAALADLSEERDLVNALAVDLTDTRRALRAATADPSLASPRHMTIAHMRAIAGRPLPGESTGAHAATTAEEGDRA